MKRDNKLTKPGASVNQNLSSSKIGAIQKDNSYSATNNKRKTIHIFGNDTDSAPAEITLKSINPHTECIVYSKDIMSSLKATSSDIYIHICESSPLTKSEANYIYHQLNKEDNAVTILKPLHEKESFGAWFRYISESGSSKRQIVKEFCELIERPDMSLKPPRRLLVSLDSKEEEHVEWTFPKLIPSGEISNISGPGGIGKSTAILSMVKALTNGDSFNGEPLKKGTVILLSFEDSAEKILKPRLRRMGANLSNIFVPNDLESLDELCKEGVLESYIKLYKPSWITLDPIVAYKPESTDINKANEVRKNLKALNRIAQKHNVAITFVAHFNKGLHGNAANRVSGSTDMINGVRSALQVYVDPDNENKRILVQCKSNFTQCMSYGLSFEITDYGVNWLGKSPYSANELSALEAQADRQDKKLEGVLHTLKALKDGPLKSQEFFANAEKEGLKKRTMEKVKSLLTRAQRVNIEGGKPGEGYNLIHLKDDYLPTELRTRTGGSNE